MNNYRVFTRTWWKHNPNWPDGREPCAGRKYTLGLTSTEQEARDWCQDYNSTHTPGKLSRKAEYQAE